MTPLFYGLGASFLSLSVLGWILAAAGIAAWSDKQISDDAAAGVLLGLLAIAIVSLGAGVGFFVAGGAQ